MVEKVIEQLRACLLTLDEHGLSIAAAHLSAAIDSLQGEPATGLEISASEVS